MKLSARDKLKGTIVEVKKALPPIKFDVERAVATASNTNEAAEALRLAARAAYAAIKASDVVTTNGRPSLWRCARHTLTRRPRSAVA